MGNQNIERGFHLLVLFFYFRIQLVGALFSWKLLKLSEGEVTVPTNDINTTVGLTLLTFLSYFYAGFKATGLYVGGGMVHFLS